MTAVRVPQSAAARGSEGDDIAGPTIELLRQLNLLPAKGDLERSDGIGSAFRGPAESVAVLEAGATALSKWWAAGLAAATAAVWATVKVFWGELSESLQGTLLVSVAVATAAALIAVGMILSSDVRGRSQAMVATIEARSAIARRMTTAAADAYLPDPEVVAPVATDSGRVVSLPMPFTVNRLVGKDSSGWLAIALDVRQDRCRYLLVRGTEHKWTDEEDVELQAPNRTIAMTA